jgi:hypothetical protein
VSGILGDLLILLIGPLWGWVWNRVTRSPWIGGWLGCAAGCLVGAVASRAWLLAVGAVVSAVIAVILYWWWRRKDRKRAASLIGAKSRALRDALVRRARETAKPRPVLRPQPGGVR